MAASLYQSVLRALLQKSTWTAVKHEATNDVFTETNLRLLLAQIGALHDRITERDLRCDDLRLALEASHSGQLFDDLASYVDAIAGRRPADEVIVREVLARELLTQTASNIAAQVNAGEFDIDTPGSLVERARQLVTGGSTTPTLTLADAALPSAGSDRGRVIPLGISAQLDAALDGGIGLGEMFVFLAPPRRGKTSIMVAVGAAAVAAGYHVLHVILGDSGPGKIVRLYERAAVRTTKAEHTDAMAEAGRSRLLAQGGRLGIKDMRGTKVTPSMLEGIIRAEARATQRDIDLVVIDYLMLMGMGGKPGKRDDRRHVYGQVTEDTRAVGARCGTRILSAWQVNRDGSQKDSIDETDLSECWDLFYHVDGLFALNRSTAEKANKKMRITILKQREDDEAVPEVSVHCDWSRMTVMDLGVTHGNSNVGNATARPGLRLAAPVTQPQGDTADAGRAAV